MCIRDRENIGQEVTGRVKYNDETLASFENERFPWIQIRVQTVTWKRVTLHRYTLYPYRYVARTCLYIINVFIPFQFVSVKRFQLTINTKQVSELSIESGSSESTLRSNNTYVLLCGNISNQGRFPQMYNALIIQL